ncbi:glycosyltransferase [Acuticoccus sp. M5D2P5]|uniref:glycosyltransferase n=1 Tax=Acuticoccus kalidii TaxID=2910977 RepID=UPI001F411460|nr:glycosyltransferase [Acuticoccus kalidii]MCF3936689.1 glycosyltransferase [Acuticoccus kalidii]
MTTECTGGVWTYAMDLVSGLATVDVEVTLFVSGGPLSLERMVEAGHRPNLRLVRSELKLEWMDDPEADLAETNAILRDLEAEIRPDIVHVNGYANAAADFAAPVVSVAHSCIPTRWRAVNGAPSPFEWNEYRQRVKRGIQAADAVVAPTASHLAAVEAEYGAMRKAHVIHHGRSECLGVLPPKAPFALAAGRFWDEAKNLTRLRDAAPLVKYPIALVGELTREHVPTTALPSEGDGGVPTPRGLTTFGRIDAPALEHSALAASVFVAPARYEPFGLGVLEAARAKMALILGDIPTMRELWDGAASFVDPDDAPAIATAIDTLLDDPAACARAGEIARERAVEYSLSAMTRGYRDLYRTLLGAPVARDDLAPFAAPRH